MINKKVSIDVRLGVNILDVDLQSSAYNLDQVVVTGTKTFKRKTDSPNQLNDEYIISPVFNEMGIKSTYTSRLNRVGVDIDYSIGVKNLTNTYQQDFDTYKNRDNNFIYGPNMPRTYYFGLVLKSI